ncbi:hypothetical protein [Spiroplasma floricola]|uniref:Uncharacterized protein n=1 Tax=Spiroplasma floricola 23-6 TaxID=1336749 RepID=A0A2K8SFG9_9MOLU|nr:hypothetical protein [Spiroplasma floricola]AUB32182.1 hypothetical protein SFLOR_v1c11360 [Spiroplasma floricola 23-6]
MKKTKQLLQKSQVKLKIKNNKFNHFLISRKPKTKLVFWNNFNEVILFIQTKNRVEFMKFLNEQLSKISNIKIISIFYMKSKNKNIICYDSKFELDISLKNSFINLIKTLFKIKLDMIINFDFVNFNIANKNIHSYDIFELKKNINNVLRTKEEVILPSYPKKIRKNINEILRKYDKIKARTTGLVGERKIRIIYKP